jgi:hypothetical protein
MAEAEQKIDSIAESAVDKIPYVNEPHDYALPVIA